MDAGYSMFAGLDIDPSDYLNDNSGAAGWPAPAEEQPIQYASPPADGRSVSQPRRSLPQMPSIDFSGIFENLRQHYPKLFWLLVVPGTAVATERQRHDRYGYKHGIVAADPKRSISSSGWHCVGSADPNR
jgi:hypothetical protein